MKIFCKCFFIVMMFLRFWRNANKETNYAKDIVPMLINFFEICAFFYIIGTI